MELFKEEMELPGVYTESIIENSATFDTSQWGRTEPMVIVGTAFDGPVGKAVPLYGGIEQGKYVFGDSFDPVAKREASLMADVKDAWDRGNRTIYAVRISGKEIYKDYRLSVDTNLKLRVKGIFPSNVNKDLSILLNITEQNLGAKIFKPASLATMAEKRQGLIDSRDSVIVTSIDLANMDMSLESSLVELIREVNEHSHNKSLRLSIVNEKGIDVLNSAEAKALKIGNVFSGLYTVGRSKTLGIPNTIVKVNAKEGQVERVLRLNTDVSAEYPIYAETKAELSNYLRRPMVSMFDFLEVTGAIDEVFEKDAIDYEEVNLTDFEIYQRLGSGYAINAQIVETNGRYRVKEVEDGNPNKKAVLKEGIYANIENLKAKYRTVAGAYADVKIKNRLPRKEEFEKAITKEAFALEEVLNIETIIDEKDLSKSKAYEIEFIAKTEDLVEVDELEEALSPDVAKVVSVLDPEDLNKKKVDYKEGSLFLGDNDGANQLFIVSNGKLVPLHEDAKDALDGTFVIADNVLYECINNSYEKAAPKSLTLLKEAGDNYIPAMLENGTFVVAKVITEASDDSEEEVGPLVLENGEMVEKPKKKAKARNKNAVQEIKVEIIGTVEQLFNPDEKVVTALESHYGENKIKIYSKDFDVLTVEEVVEMLNEDKDFSKLFKVSINKLTEAQEIMEYVIEGAGESNKVVFENDKEVIMDLNKFIPYRTDDNFARHLAQHCMYTTLKTSPAHGVIGCKPLLDTSLSSVANKVKELVNLKLVDTLYAKKANGANMLDENNNPYHIGRKISVVFGQYLVKTSDGYNRISNMAPGYAAMTSTLSLDKSSTCQPINVTNPSFELTKYQLEDLTKAGYVTLKESYTKGIVITDGITMDQNSSPHKRLSANRISEAVEDLIREVSEPYIGTMNNLANQNSLRSAIKSKMDDLSGKIIESYDFALRTGGGANVGILDIDFEILPINEIKQIRGHVRVNQGN